MRYHPFHGFILILILLNFSSISVISQIQPENLNRCFGINEGDVFEYKLERTEIHRNGSSVLLEFSQNETYIINSLPKEGDDNINVERTIETEDDIQTQNVNLSLAFIHRQFIWMDWEYMTNLLEESTKNFEQNYDSIASYTIIETDETFTIILVTFNSIAEDGRTVNTGEIDAIGTYRYNKSNGVLIEQTEENIMYDNQLYSIVQIRTLVNSYQDNIAVTCQLSDSTETLSSEIEDTNNSMISDFWEGEIIILLIVIAFMTIFIVLIRIQKSHRLTEIENYLGYDVNDWINSLPSIESALAKKNVDYIVNSGINTKKTAELIDYLRNEFEEGSFREFSKMIDEY